MSWQKIATPSARHPIRVLHLGTAPLLPDHPEFELLQASCDHPGRWVVNLALAQRTFEGIQAEIVVRLPGAHKAWTSSLDGVPIHYVPVPRCGRGKTCFFFEKSILAGAVMRLNPDLVHAHGTEESNALAALRCPVAKVLTLQGCYFLLNSKNPPRPLSRAWIVERLEKRAIPRFRHIIAKSRYIEEHLQKKFPGVHPHLIPNTYDALLELVCISRPRENRMVFVGSLVPWKGLHLLKDAFRKIAQCLPDVTLLVCGDRPAVTTGYEGTLKRDLVEILGNRVQFQGIVSASRLFDILSTSRVLVAPSLEDMFGNQCIEALLCGAHVLTIDGNALSDHIRTFGNRTVSTVESLTSNLLHLLHKPHGPIEVERARSSILACMAPSTIARRHAEIYQEALMAWHSRMA